MAACGSLQHIFDKPMPENPSLLESLSPCHQIKSAKPTDDHSSFTELFGELHFKENPGSILRAEDKIYKENDSKKPRINSMNLESLQLCTEGLGSESFDDVDDLDVEFGQNWKNNQEEKTKPAREEGCKGEVVKRTRTSEITFPPPISCIGQSGKPWVCFKAFREDGRFVLKEIKIPTQEFLHAKREDGRLKLQFFQPEDDEIINEDDEDEDEEIGEFNGENNEEENDLSEAIEVADDT